MCGAKNFKGLNLKCKTQLPPRKVAHWLKGGEWEKLITTSKGKENTCTNLAWLTTSKAEWEAEEATRLPLWSTAQGTRLPITPLKYYELDLSSYSTRPC